MTTESTETLAASPASPPTHASSLRLPLVLWNDYQRDNAHIFPTPQSWKWFVHQHRAELIEAGALCYVAGRVFVVPEAFDGTVVKIGTRLAAARAA